MAEIDGLETPTDQLEVLRSLLQVGVKLTAIRDFSEMLDLILKEVRKLARAEAGSLYVLEKGKLRLAVVQNDRVPARQISEALLNREFGLTNDSLAGFVATGGEVMNIPNTYMLPAGTPFRINREFDAATGYRAKSILAIPLKCPDGQCIGVLELFNRLEQDGKIGAFPESKGSATFSLAAMAAVTIHNAQLQEQLKKSNLDTIIRLSVAAEFRDNETAAHLRRLSHTSALIAQAMGLPRKQVDVTRFASPMHDVGKIGIPDAILQKPGPLTSEERKIIEEHPAIATEILGDPLNELVDAARAVALTHHERWDGNGYPMGLAGDQIPIIGRIVGLADVFDALVTKRCYKEAYPWGKALDIIREEDGNHFDPAVVKAFFEVVDRIKEFYDDPANRDGTAEATKAGLDGIVQS